MISDGCFMKSWVPCLAQVKRWRPAWCDGLCPILHVTVTTAATHDEDVANSTSKSMAKTRRCSETA